MNDDTGLKTVKLMIFIKNEVHLNQLQIFFIRVVLGAVFAVVLSRFFYPDANIIYVIGLGIILVGLAYVAEYFRMKRTNKNDS